MTFTPKKRHTMDAGPPGPVKRKRRSTEETDEQIAFVAWARKRGLWLWSTPNEHSGSARRGQWLNRMGRLSGVADVIIGQRLPNVPDARGAALEFKSKTGTASGAQKAWIRRARDEGWEVEVVRSAREAVAVCARWGL